MIHHSYECWEGQLPLVIKEPENDVVFLNIYYDKRHIKLNGLDYYFAYENVAGGWSNYKLTKYIGRKYTFVKNNMVVEDLIEVPEVKSFHLGILIPDAAAREIGLI